MHSRIYNKITARGEEAARVRITHSPPSPSLSLSFASSRNLLEARAFLFYSARSVVYCSISLSLSLSLPTREVDIENKFAEGRDHADDEVGRDTSVITDKTDRTRLFSNHFLPLPNITRSRRILFLPPGSLFRRFYFILLPLPR